MWQEIDPISSDYYMEKNEVYILGLIVEGMTPTKVSYLIMEDNTLVLAQSFKEILILLIEIKHFSQK